MTIEERYRKASEENNIKEMLAIGRSILLSGGSVEDVNALREGRSQGLEDKLITFSDEEWAAWVKFTEDAEPGIVAAALEKIRKQEATATELLAQKLGK